LPAGSAAFSLPVLAGFARRSKMSIWITVLLALLPMVLRWIIELLARGGKLTAPQANKINQLIWYGNQIREEGVKAGCKPEGTAPAPDEPAKSDDWSATWLPLLAVSAGLVCSVLAYAGPLPQSTLAVADVDRPLSYQEATAKAVKDKKPLCVWVAYKCPSTAGQLPECVHCFLDAFEGSKDQRVVVALPNSVGWLSVAGVVAAPDCCAANIRRLLGIDVGATRGSWGTGAVMKGGAHGACAT
jgi:hypothetical protein